MDRIIVNHLMAAHTVELRRAHGVPHRTAVPAWRRLVARSALAVARGADPDLLPARTPLVSR